jgi:hypothetical protein
MKAIKIYNEVIVFSLKGWSYQCPDDLSDVTYLSMEASANNVITFKNCIDRAVRMQTIITLTSKGIICLSLSLFYRDAKNYFYNIIFSFGADGVFLDADRDKLKLS